MTVFRIRRPCATHGSRRAAVRTKPSRQYVMDWLVMVCHADYGALLPLTYRELMEMRRRYLENAGVRPRQRLFTKRRQK